MTIGGTGLAPANGKGHAPSEKQAAAAKLNFAVMQLKGAQTALAHHTQQFLLPEQWKALDDALSTAIAHVYKEIKNGKTRK